MPLPRRSMPAPHPRATMDRRRAFTWEGPFENWARAYVKKNFWRVRTSMGSEADALQECGVVFARCINRYAASVDNPAWMMSLFKMSVANEFHSIAVKDGQLRQSRDPERLAQHASMLPTSTVNHGPLLVRWAQASAELQQVIKVIADAPAELLEMMFANNDKLQTNRRLRRLCGIKANVDLLGEMHELLS